MRFFSLGSPSFLDSSKYTYSIPSRKPHPRCSKMGHQPHLRSRADSPRNVFISPTSFAWDQITSVGGPILAFGYIGSYTGAPVFITGHYGVGSASQTERRILLDWRWWKISLFIGVDLSSNIVTPFSPIRFSLCIWRGYNPLKGIFRRWKVGSCRLQFGCLGIANWYRSFRIFR